MKREITVQVDENLDPVISGCPAGYSVQVFFSAELLRQVQSERVEIVAAPDSRTFGGGVRRKKAAWPSVPSAEDLDREVRKSKKRKSLSSKAEESIIKKIARERRGRRRGSATLEIIGNTNDHSDVSWKPGEDNEDEEEDGDELVVEEEDEEEAVEQEEQEEEKSEDKDVVVVKKDDEEENEEPVDDDDDDDKEEEKKVKEEEQEGEEQEKSSVDRYYIAYDMMARLSKKGSLAIKNYRLLRVYKRTYHIDPETGKKKFNSLMDEQVCTLVASNPQGPKPAGQGDKPRRVNNVHEVLPGRTTDVEQLMKYEQWKEENPELDRHAMHAVTEYTSGKQKIPVRDQDN